MKNFFNAILRLLVKIALHFYFKRIRVSGKQHIPKGKPVILVANHQNALIDPLLLATHTRLNPWFLTRAAVFKNPAIAKILNFIRMLPVYRVRDGFSSIQQNQQIFDKTFEILKDNGTVIIFAEGSHSLNRYLRPLSKGFTRMAFGLKEKYPELEPVILPVGIDFSAHRRTGSNAKITFGEAIPVTMDYSQSGKLTKLVEKALKNLVVEIPEENYESYLDQLIENQIDITEKESVNAFLNEGKKIKVFSNPAGMRNKVMKIFHFPFYLIWLWIDRKIEDRVFDSTFKFVIGFFLIPFWYLGLLWMSFTSAMGSWALTCLILSIFSMIWNKNPQE
jgi:1-acyl-sn-glycerol-3-phosphate acyltransferase